MLPTEVAFPLYVDIYGNPLDNGYIYFGQVGQNPITAPVTVYWDAAGTQPAAQPLRTEDGYIVRNGTPANVFYSAAYSQLVHDKLHQQVYYAPDSTDYSAATYVQAAVAQFPTSIGSSLIGFIQSGTGAILETVQDELRSRVRVEQFGAVGDGTTDSTTAIQNAKNRVAAGGVLEFGPGTFLVNSDACLAVSAAGIKLKGQRGATIIKAKNGANLTTLVALAADGCTIEDIIIDGNRANGGIQVGFYGLFLTASNLSVKNCEIRNCVSVSTFVGSSTATPKNIRIDECWIHDNGGTTTTTGFGVGIFGGGSFPVDDLRITNCRIEENYNTVAGFPGDSTAMNIIGTNIIVDHCFIKNNHNVGGGQLALTSNGVDGSVDGRFIVSNNEIVHTVAFAGENTTAIEIEGRKFTVHDNICQSLNGDGVRIETSGGDGIVHDNVIMCTNNGVNLITVGGTGIRKCQIHNNQILSAGTGISVQAGPGDVVVTDNFIDPSVPTKMAGVANMALVRGNVNYIPANQAGMVAGASPFTFPILNYDAVYSCAVVNGMFSAAANGVNFSILARIPILVKANQQFTVAWAGTAPTFDLSTAQGG
jgi:hypothetical protein